MTERRCQDDARSANWFPKKGRSRASKRKMRAFRPASRRHDGSAGGIATAATCSRRCLHHPVGHRAVVIMHALAVISVVPVGLAFAVIHRRRLELLLGKRHDIATAIGVVVEHTPGDGMVFFTQAEKAA